jgi:hypothetical protein
MKSFAPRRFSLALALSLAALVSPAVAAPPSGAFTYQGELKENGQPVNAALPMTFRLFAAATGGAPLAELSRPAVTVEGGRFTEALTFPPSVVNGAQALWLEVVVNGTTLSERQQLTGAVYSLSTRGIVVDDQGRVGLGTASPQRRLSVVGGMDISDTMGQGVWIASNSVVLADGTEDSFYRFSGIDQRHTFSTGGTDRVTIDGAGRVGIGTQSPTAALHVAGAAGDGTVRLPASSIGPAELLAEPGVAAVRRLDAVPVGYTPLALGERTLTVPSDGYIVAIGTGTLASQMYGNMITFNILLNGAQQGMADTISTTGDFTAPSAPLTSVRTIPVTAGTHTVTFLGESLEGTPTVLRPGLTVMFFPTAYGAVEFTGQP